MGKGKVARSQHCKVADIKRLVATAVAYTHEENVAAKNETVTHMLVPLIEDMGPANLLLCVLLASAEYSRELEEDDCTRSILSRFLAAGFVLLEEVTNDILNSPQ